MKRIHSYLLGLAGIVLITTSCVFDFTNSISGDGNVKVESREIPEFKSVEASNGLHVFITFGDPRSLEVEADANLHDVIRTEVVSGTLRVYSERNIRNEKAKNIRITIPSLEEIEVSSAADVECENILKTERLTLSASSAGELRLETHAKEIRVDASSSGSVEISGEASELKADASSAGSIDADKLKVKNCNVTASSAGSVKVWVTEELNAQASSAGNVRYQGEPTNKKIDTSSAGSVAQR
jgi:hypothetical protein